MPEHTTTLATQATCEAFHEAARMLRNGSAADIPDADIAAFLALDWMVWREGTLRITALGRMALARTRSRALEAA